MPGDSFKLAWLLPLNFQQTKNLLSSALGCFRWTYRRECAECANWAKVNLCFLSIWGLVFAILGAIFLRADQVAVETSLNIVGTENLKLLFGLCHLKLHFVFSLLTTSRFKWLQRTTPLLVWCFPWYFSCTTVDSDIQWPCSIEAIAWGLPAFSERSPSFLRGQCFDVSPLSFSGECLDGSRKPSRRGVPRHLHRRIGRS